jgi:rRNA maturation endonuclease Nob1
MAIRCIKCDKTFEEEELMVCDSCHSKCCPECMSDEDLFVVENHLDKE